MTSDSPAEPHLQNIHKWIESSESFLHPSIVIKKSSLGGYGLFTKTALEEKTELIRIRQNCVYGLESFDMMELFMLSSPVWKSDWHRISPILKNTKSTQRFPDPTTFIRDCVWAFYMILNLKDLEVKDPLTDFKLYVDVLLKTPIADIDIEEDSYDQVTLGLQDGKVYVKDQYDELIKRYPEAKKLMSFKMAYQLNQAVTSRLQDVPEESALLQSYIALIPILDFTNHHTTEHNAKIKLDLKSPHKDIVLILERNIPAGQEILMQYYDSWEINTCMKIYGFVPQAPRSLVWEYPDFTERLHEAFGSVDVYRVLTALWLRCPYQIRLVEDKAGNVTFEPESFKLFLMLIPDLTRDPKGYKKLPNYSRELDEEVLLDEYSGSTAYGVLYNKTPVDLHDIMKQTRIDTPDAIDALARRTTDVLFMMNDVMFKDKKMPQSGLVRNDNGGVDAYERVKEEMAQKFFATPYDEVLERVRRSIENYQFEENWELEDRDD